MPGGVATAPAATPPRPQLPHHDRGHGGRLDARVERRQALPSRTSSFASSASIFSIRNACTSRACRVGAKSPLPPRRSGRRACRRAGSGVEWVLRALRLRLIERLLHRLQVVEQASAASTSSACSSPKRPFTASTCSLALRRRRMARCVRLTSSRTRTRKSNCARKSSGVALVRGSGGPGTRPRARPPRRRRPR